MMTSPHPDCPAIKESDALFPPASLGVIGSGQLGRMFIQAAQRMGYRAGVLERHGGSARGASGSLDGRWASGPPTGLADIRRPSRGGDRRVRERLGPRAAVAGSPTAGASRLANALDQPEPAARETLSGRPQHPACAVAARSQPRPNWTSPFTDWGCR